jgi:predicted transcriptional regulator
MARDWVQRGGRRATTIVFHRRDDSVTFRLDENIKRFLQELARQEGRTLSNYLEHVLEQHIDDLAPAKKQAVLEALVRSPEPDSGEGQPVTFSTRMKQASIGELLTDLEQAQQQERDPSSTLNLIDEQACKNRDPHTKAIKKK